MSFPLNSQDFTVCKSDATSAYKDFLQAESAFSSKDYQTALSRMSVGLKSVSDTLNDCGIQEMVSKTLDSRAALIGGAAVKEIEGVVSILVNGGDIFQEAHDAVRSK